jgi:hypothetical protein
MSLLPSFDVIKLLPPGAADRLRALRQRFLDTNKLIPRFEEIREANTAKIEAEQRLKRLFDHQSVGGFHLDPTDPRVIEQQRLLDKLSDDARRLRELQEVRSAAWKAASYVLSAVETWLKHGVPGNCQLEAAEIEEPKLLKNESITDAIERLRRRGRELKADLHRIQSAPYPSSYCKRRMRETVEALAQAPDVTTLIEFDRDIAWPTMRVQSSVYNTGTPAIAFAEVPDTVALLAWAFRDALIARLDAEIDAEADDAAALRHEQRQQREAEAQDDLLAIERDESWLVWSAQAQNLPVEHRADINPVALLGVRLVTASTVNRQGTSPSHVVTFAGAR